MSYLLLTPLLLIPKVDLDTIDLSNLNRQFLFRMKHIKKSKALVAVEAVRAFSPQAQLTAHHKNIITTPDFDLDWYRQFDLILNALDNLGND